MKDELELMIKKYEGLQQTGESFAQELLQQGRPIKCQKIINALWSQILKDLHHLADINKHDHLHKKRSN